MHFNRLNFKPLTGTSSSHLQTIISALLPPGISPPSENQIVDLGSNEFLSCEVSTPATWKESDQTAVLVHGMGGSHASNYMVRMAQKLYLRGQKVIRVNLRGCGSGKELSKLLYHAGTSQDILKILFDLKQKFPASEIALIGFSLGGNIILKLAGELGLEAKKLVKVFIAVSAPLNLAESVSKIQEKKNCLYHLYYLKRIRAQSGNQKIATLYAFDDQITAPSWGYKSANDYYEACSSLHFLPHIQQSTHLLFAQDDPFISLDQLQEMTLPSAINVWTTEKGGHLGFLGKTATSKSFYWMDELLLNWIGF